MDQVRGDDELLFNMTLVRERNFSIPALLFGLVFGYLFSVLLSGAIDDRNVSTTGLPATSGTSEAAEEEIDKTPRVLCMVLTAPENHANRAQTVKMTWGKRCNYLLFMSTVQDDSLPSVALPVPEGGKHLWGKTREAFRYAWQNYRDKVDWFFKVEDDTYAIVENLKQFLLNYDTSTPIWFGYNRSHSSESNRLVGFHEGAGYVLSREATRRFAEIGYFNNLLCKHHHVGKQRTEMGLCMMNLNVTAGESADAEGKERFFPYVPEDRRTNHGKRQPSVTDLGCCSELAITFHYFEPDQFTLMEFLIYRLEPYGLSFKSKT